MTKVFYVVECEASHCNVEVHLNDVPIARRGVDHGQFAAIQSNEWVLDGTNELALVISPGATPGEALAGPGGARRRARLPAMARASVRLKKYPAGAVVGGPKGEQLAALEWRSDGETHSWPRVAGALFDLGPRLGKWAWEAAPRAPRDAAATAELLTLLEEIRRDLDLGSPETLLAQSRARLADLARAYELKPGEREEQIRTLAKSDAADPGWGMQPLDPSTFDFRLCARGRLLQLVTTDGESPVRERPKADGGVGYYDFFLAHLDRRWSIVR